MLRGVEQQGGAGAEQGSGLGGDERAVGQFDSGRGIACQELTLVGRHGATAVGGGELHLLHQQHELVHLSVVVAPLGHRGQCGVVAANDFLTRRLAAHLVVRDAEACHIYAHIGRRLVRTLAVDALEDGVQHGEDLDVAVVVDRGLAVRFQVEVVNHIHVVEVGRSGLVSHVDGVLQGDIPDGEGLELGIARLHAAPVLVVELTETDCHLSAAGREVST